MTKQNVFSGATPEDLARRYREIKDIVAFGDSHEWPELLQDIVQGDEYSSTLYPWSFEYGVARMNGVACGISFTDTADHFDALDRLLLSAWVDPDDDPRGGWHYYILHITSEGVVEEVERVNEAGAPLK